MTQAHRRGSVLTYSIFALALLLGFATLSMDWGRVQLAKLDLQQAADTAARYAAGALPQGVAAVQARAAASIAENKVDGNPLVFNAATDVEFGTWNQATKTFTVVTGTARTAATAIRVSVARDAAHGSELPMVFGKAINRPTIAVHATSVVTRGKPFNVDVEADSCPWLAGMPNGSVVARSPSNPTSSYAPNQSPAAVNGIALKPGKNIVFRQASGQTSYTDAGLYGPDGNTSWIVAQDAANGINTTKAPLNCLVGIFLDDRTPSAYSQGGVGDYSSTASRDFSTLAPPLKQVFFIGDGMNSANALQEFTVPPGATRLYLGIMDEQGWWWDNTGTLSATVMDDHITLVK